MNRDVFTTGQAAKVCGVSARLIANACDSGDLRAFRIPGSKHRRIPRAALLAWLHRHGVPLDGLAPTADERRALGGGA